MLDYNSTGTHVRLSHSRDILISEIARTDYLLVHGGVASRMATEEQPFITTRQDLRYRGRDHKIDSLFRKWTSVCPL